MSDTQQSHGQLGKKVVAPEPAPKPDEYEFKVSHGTPVYRNKRTGQLQTNAPSQNLPPVNSPAIDFILEVIAKNRQEQEDDGFSVGEFGGF